MVIIRLILLALVPVYLADGLSDGSEDGKAKEYYDNPDGKAKEYYDKEYHDGTVAMVCNSYINRWFKITAPTRRVHKGIYAEPGMFPFMGGLGWRYKDSTKFGFHCAGTLISAKFILTAAHCTILPTKTAIKYVSRKPNIVAFDIENIGEVNRTFVHIKNIIQHPKYHSPMKYHDIALIESDVNIEFTDFVYPACLWTQGFNPDFEIKPVVVGWQFEEPSDIPNAKAERLKYGKVNLLENVECNDIVTSIGGIRLLRDGIVDSQLCAQGGEEGDTCKGDSGGPLLYYGPIKRYFPTVIAVTSFGLLHSGPAACQPTFPGVYTRVSQYIDWIEKVAFSGVGWSWVQAGLVLFTFHYRRARRAPARLTGGLP